MTLGRRGRGRGTFGRERGSSPAPAKARRPTAPCSTCPKLCRVGQTCAELCMDRGSGTATSNGRNEANPCGHTPYLLQFVGVTKFATESHVWLDARPCG